MSEQMVIGVVIVAALVVIGMVVYLIKGNWELIKKLRKADKQAKLEAKRIELGLKQAAIAKKKKEIQDQIEELMGLNK